MSRSILASRNHPILITEVLALILSYLDQKTVSRTIPVSKPWADVALDHAWREVHDIFRLLNVLGPLTQTKQHSSLRNLTLHSYRFKRALSVHDWNRFECYSKRIRKLSYDEPNRRHIEQSVWDEIRRTSPKSGILPNLLSLNWFASSPEKQLHSVLFMTSNITHLAIHVHHSRYTLAYVHDILTRVPHVHHFELRSDAAMRDIEDTIVPLIRGFAKLKCFITPMYALTSTLIEELSRLKQLDTVKFGKAIENGTGDRRDVEELVPSLQPGAFSSLRQFSFCTRLAQAIQCVQHPSFPKNLHVLEIQLLAAEDHHLLMDLFAVVSRDLLPLRQFHVDFVIAPETPITYPPPPMTGRSRVPVFLSLLQCHNLTIFEFRWDYQLNITDEDLAEIASAWPSLEIFILNCEPIPEIATRPTLSLGALIPFARHCPHLRKLGLFIDGDSIPDSSIVGSIEPFKSLKTLCVGTSPISYVEPVALFLSQLCSQKFEIVSGIRWPDAYSLTLDLLGIVDDRRVTLTDNWVRWNDVSKVLPLAIKARLDERSKMSDLRKQIEMLARVRMEERERMSQLEEEVKRLKGH
ncbi:hypothetical protein C8Q75DRAFT_744681 [Abortiporus biennis]|nr:hypothetical protein C8Q75DRAFT_744681 [Abortiporus biennis]